MRNILSNRISKTGMIGFFLFVCIALLAGIISPYDPYSRFEPYSSPSRAHLLGTNDMGHDILSELIYGTRVSLTVGLLTALLATGIGVIIGLTAGYFRGIVDETLMAITDVFLMVPRIPLVIILAVFLKPSYWIIILVLGLIWWTTTARVVRSKTMQVREMGFVISSQSMGFSHLHTIFSEIFPNTIFVIIPKFMLTVASAMISEASLSFLGLGDPTKKSWGMMIRYAFERGGFIRDLWWWYTIPGIAITCCVLSIVLISFSLESYGSGFSGGREKNIPKALGNSRN